MIKTALALAALVAIGSPALAETAQAPKKSFPSQQMFSGLMASDAPSVAVAWRRIDNNITCRSKARTKLFELGATGMASSDENLQKGTLGNIQAIVWCQDVVGAVFISVSGHNSSSVTEARDAIYRAF